MHGDGAQRRSLLLGTIFVLMVGLITGAVALSSSIGAWRTASADRFTITVVDRAEAAVQALAVERRTNDEQAFAVSDQAFSALAKVTAGHHLDELGLDNDTIDQSVKDLLTEPVATLEQARGAGSLGITELIGTLDLVGASVQGALTAPSLKQSLGNFITYVANNPSVVGTDQELRGQAVSGARQTAESLTSQAQGRCIAFGVTTFLLGAGLTITGWRWWRGRPSPEQRQEAKRRPLSHRLTDNWRRFTGANDNYADLPETKVIGPPGAGANSRPSPAPAEPVAPVATPMAGPVAGKSSAQRAPKVPPAPVSPAPRMVGGVRQQSARPPSITNPPTGQISAILERQASGLPLPRAALGTPTGAAPRPAPISPPPARQAGSASPWAATPLPAAIKPGAAQVPIAQVMSEALSQVSRPHQVRWSLRSEALVPTELVARLAQVVAELIDSSTAKNPSLVVLVTVNTAGSVLYVTVSDRAAAGPNGPFGLGHRSRAINAVAARMGATLAARAGPGGRGSDVTLALPLPAESLRPVTPLRQHPGQINPKPLVVAAARPSAAIGARPAASAPHTSSPRAPQTLQESGAAVAPPPAPPPAPRPGVPAGPQPVNPEDPWHTLRR